MAEAHPLGTAQYLRASTRLGNFIFRDQMTGRSGIYRSLKIQISIRNINYLNVKKRLTKFFLWVLFGHLDWISVNIFTPLARQCQNHMYMKAYLAAMNATLLVARIPGYQRKRQSAGIFFVSFIWPFGLNLGQYFSPLSPDGVKITCRCRLTLLPCMLPY